MTQKQAILEIYQENEHTYDMIRDTRFWGVKNLAEN